MVKARRLIVVRLPFSFLFQAQVLFASSYFSLILDQHNSHLRERIYKAFAYWEERFNKKVPFLKKRLHRGGFRMAEQQESINVSIADGEPFFAHEVTVNFTPTQFTFDFKCITPRNDMRAKTGASFLLKHNVVMVDVWHAKAFLDVLQNVLSKYEETFGKIKKPAALEKAEKTQKELNKKAPVKGESPSYLG